MVVVTEGQTLQCRLLFSAPVPHKGGASFNPGQGPESPSQGHTAEHAIGICFLSHLVILGESRDLLLGKHMSSGRIEAMTKSSENSVTGHF